MRAGRRAQLLQVPRYRLSRFTEVMTDCGQSGSGGFSDLLAFSRIIGHTAQHGSYVNAG